VRAILSTFANKLFAVDMSDIFCLPDLSVLEFFRPRISDLIQDLIDGRPISMYSFTRILSHPSVTLTYGEDNKYLVSVTKDIGDVKRINVEVSGASPFDFVFALRGGSHRYDHFLKVRIDFVLPSDVGNTIEKELENNHWSYSRYGDNSILVASQKEGFSVLMARINAILSFLDGSDRIDVLQKAINIHIDKKFLNTEKVLRLAGEYRKNMDIFLDVFGGKCANRTEPISQNDDEISFRFVYLDSSIDVVKFRLYSAFNLLLNIRD
jgi:hypothetical protein